MVELLVLQVGETAEGVSVRNERVLEIGRLLDGPLDGDIVPIEGEGLRAEAEKDAVGVLVARDSVLSADLVPEKPLDDLDCVLVGLLVASSVAVAVLDKEPELVPADDVTVKLARLVDDRVAAIDIEVVSVCDSEADVVGKDGEDVLVLEEVTTTSLPTAVQEQQSSSTKRTICGAEIRLMPLLLSFCTFFMSSMLLLNMDFHLEVELVREALQREQGLFLLIRFTQCAKRAATIPQYG